MARERTAAGLLTGQTGRAISRAYCRSLDAIIHRAVAPTASFDVVRLGGWARGDLCPRSDVDLLLLLPEAGTPNRARAEEDASAFLRLLWDEGLKLGHVVGDANEIIEQARADHTRATSLLEATPLVDRGPATFVLGEFRKRVMPAMRRQFVQDKIDEAIARRARYGGRVHLTEPNIKLSPGALRDFHLVLWMSLALKPLAPGDDSLSRLLIAGLLFPREVDQLRAAWDELIALRTALHVATGRPEDRLSYEHQDVAAQAVGEISTPDETRSEAMMRRYFNAALAVRGVVKDVRDRLLDDTTPKISSKSVVKERGIVARGGRIHYTRPTDDKSAAWMIDVVRVSEEEGLRLAPLTRSAIRRAVAMAPPLAWVDDEDTGAALSRLCRSSQIVGTPWQHLLELGVLPLVLRDFHRLAGRFKADGYHTTTTDGHIAHAIDNALQAVSGALPPPVPIEEAVARTPAQHLVVYGALFHDLGKGLPGDHSEVGVSIVEREGPRLGLSPNEIRTVQFLTKEHLLLSHASQRRDLADPAVVDDLCDRIRTEDRARLLTMLTWIDIAAVSPGMLTDWKARLLGMAADRVVKALQGDQGVHTKALLDAEVRSRAREALAELVADSSGTLSPNIAEAVDAFVAKASRRFLASRHDVSLKGDAIAFSLFRDDPTRPVVIADVAEGGRAHVVRVIAHDRKGMLSDLCGAIAAEGANLLHAHIDTRNDGIVLDSFRIDDGNHHALPRGALVQVLAALEDVVQGKRKGVPRLVRSKSGPAVAALVRVLDGRDSFGARVVEVRARDRPGLLAALTAVISDAGGDIELALVTTDGAIARDTFYIQADVESLDTDALKRELLIACT